MASKSSSSSSLLTALTVQVLLSAVGASQAESSVFSSEGADAYEAFRQAFGRALAEDGVDYETRLALFQQRRAEAEAHNALPQKSWVATVNKFSDYTEEEKRALFGYRRSATWRPSSLAEGGAADDDDTAESSSGGSFLEVQPRVHGANLATTVDWRSKLARTTDKSFIREQGACGSCWAVAAAGALETHAELAGLPPMKLSYEQLVDCTPNPQHCGGDGACKGATGELAFAFAQKEGVVPASAYAGYQHGGNGQCKLGANKRLSVKILGWTKLPENRLAPLMEAVSKKGPIVVSVDAGMWTSYASGVFDACARDATVNHAVLMVGYGVDRDVGKKYWLIRNSWGGEWGEDGYMRLERHSGDQGEQGYCGTDYDPKQGVGCDGGPRSIPVCGMCGVMSDTSYPYGLSLVKGE